MKKIKSYFRTEQQFQLFGLLLLSSLFCMVLLGVRLCFIDFDFNQIQSARDIAHYRGTPTFLFLVWNLFLAWIPYLLVLALPLFYQKIKSKIVVVIVLLCWLLFFPNAPYILTDLLHLRKRIGIPLWYDMMLFSSFAWTGLMLGYLSLLEVQVFLRQFFPKKIIHGLSVSFIFLCGFGIYLGRFQRWNSWDIVTNPTSLCVDILNLITQPHVIGLTMVISTFLLLGYFTLNTLAQSESKNIKS